MCGIAGGNGSERPRIQSTLHSVWSRGPDAMRRESFVPLETSFGHIRLSLLDLKPRSRQQTLSTLARFQVLGQRVEPMRCDAFGDELPQILQKQPKRPFNPPLRKYLRRRCAALEDSRLSPQALVLDRRFFAARLHEFRSMRRDHSTLLWGWRVLNRWLASVCGHMNLSSTQAA